jgi:hypothetical protein
MEFKRLKYFISKVLNEADKLEKMNIKGEVTTTKKYTQTQVFSFVISIATLFILRTGFSDNFAGFIITFLGIFIGLFASVVVSLHDKSKTLIEGLETMTALEKAQNVKLKNYMIQFTGLTAYSIVIGLFLALLLSIVLLADGTKSNIFQYSFIRNLNELNVRTVLNFCRVVILCIHRLLVVYLFLRFFTITIYAVSSYFSFLISDYRKLKIKQPQEVR